MFLSLFNSFTIHSEITIKLSTIIQRLKTRANETILLKVYHINIKQINVKKYTKGKAIVTQNDILKPTNKTKINKIISQLCRKFETNVSKTSFI
jgi:hypothetical protein